MVVAERSVHFFLGKLEQAVIQYSMHILSLVTDKRSLGAHLKQNVEFKINGNTFEVYDTTHE